MKNILTLFLIVLSCSVALAIDNGQSVQVNLYSTSTATDPEPKSDEDPSNYHRMPTRPILCSISTDGGVTFCDGSNPDIISYKIKDIDNNTVTVTGDETDFVQTLFSLIGEYQILFSTDEYIYYGSINL